MPGHLPLFPLHHSAHSRLRWLAAVALLLAALLSACDQALPAEIPGPVLVTLPAADSPEASPAGEVQTEAAPAVPSPPPIVIPTASPPPEGIAAARLLWQWQTGAGSPAALAVSGDRLAVLTADGRLAWLDANTGQVTASTFLWPGILEGDTLGEVLTDGRLAIVAAHQILPGAGPAEQTSRARLAVYGPAADALWSLPGLGGGQLYSATLAPGVVIVGRWPDRLADSTLAAYLPDSGGLIWDISVPPAGEPDAPPPELPEPAAYRQLMTDGSRLVALFESAEGSGVAAFDWQTGERLWRWLAAGPADQPVRFALGSDTVVVLGPGQVVALNVVNGVPRWRVEFAADPEAGLVVQQGMLFLVPAPTDQVGFRPGVVALSVSTGTLAWHALNGLLVESLAGTADDVVIWVLIKDFDSGQVALSALDGAVGLEQVRLPVDDRPDATFRLAARDRRVYVLGDILHAFGY